MPFDVCHHQFVLVNMIEALSHCARFRGLRDLQHYFFSVMISKKNHPKKHPATRVAMFVLFVPYKSSIQSDFSTLPPSILQYYLEYTSM